MVRLLAAEQLTIGPPDDPPVALKTQAVGAIEPLRIDAGLRLAVGV
jgi:hypothetical protein